MVSGFRGSREGNGVRLVGWRNKERNQRLRNTIAVERVPRHDDNTARAFPAVGDRREGFW